MIAFVDILMISGCSWVVELLNKMVLFSLFYFIFFFCILTLSLFSVFIPAFLHF